MRLYIFEPDDHGVGTCLGLRACGIEPQGFFTLDASLAGTQRHGLPVVSFAETPRSRYDRVLIPHSPRGGDAVMACCRRGLVHGRDFQFAQTPDFFAEARRALRIFRQYSEAARSFRPSGLQGARVLDIGSGALVELDALLLAGGAQSVVGVDITTPPNFPEITVQHAALMHVLSTSDAPADRDLARGVEDLALAGAERTCADLARLQYYPVTLDDLPGRLGQFDMVFSNAVLEHVPDPEAVIAAMAGLTRPGGLSRHCVDLRDHRDNASPYSHLAMSADQWREAGENPVSGYLRSNRWRGRDYLECFGRHGHDVEDYELVMPEPEVLASFPEGVHPDFSGYGDDELRAVSCILRARRLDVERG